MKKYKTFQSLEKAVKWWEDEVSFSNQQAHTIKYPEHQKLAQRGLVLARKAMNARLDHLDHVKEMNGEIKKKRNYLEEHNSDHVRAVIRGMVKQVRVLKLTCHRNMETHLLQCADSSFDDFPFWVGDRITEARANV